MSSCANVVDLWHAGIDTATPVVVSATIERVMAVIVCGVELVQSGRHTMAERKQRQESGIDATRATARLPGLAVDINFHRSPDGDWERMSINLRATPSFETFGRLFEAANPFVFWAEAIRLTWMPWVLAAQTMMQSPSGLPRLPEVPQLPKASG